MMFVIKRNLDAGVDEYRISRQSLYDGLLGKIQGALILLHQEEQARQVHVCHPLPSRAKGDGRLMMENSIMEISIKGDGRVI
jgi:hypothetical protein